MATAKQIAANRRNAQKSTGPRTEEGKAKVSQNRTTHGLCGKFFVLAEVEKQEDYETLLARFIEEEQPTTQRQHELVVKMARHTWLANRALQLQPVAASPARQISSQRREISSQERLPAGSPGFAERPEG